MDKTFWRSIAANNFAIPAGFSIEQLTDEMLPLLGASDPKLRDYYIYTALENWIQRELYSPAQLHMLQAKLLDNLTRGLGEQGDDQVLLRSFSALTLSEILKYDNAHPFLTADEIHQTLEQGVAYLIREQDLRGYVTDKGWMHALAHAGDLLAVLARHHYVNNHDLERILTALAEKITAPTLHLFSTFEDERLALVVIAALTRKQLRYSFWLWWCQQLGKIEDTMHWENTVRFARQEDICAYHNTRLFLHAVYFQLTLAGYKLPGTRDLIEATIEVLHRLDPGFYSVEVLKVVDPEIDTNDV